MPICWCVCLASVQVLGSLLSNECKNTPMTKVSRGVLKACLFHILELSQQALNSSRCRFSSPNCQLIILDGDLHVGAFVNITCDDESADPGFQLTLQKPL